jgi:predicted PurR-regulated permease PerM
MPRIAAEEAVSSRPTKGNPEKSVCWQSFSSWQPIPARISDKIASPEGTMRGDAAPMNKSRPVTAAGVLLAGAIGLLLYFGHVAFIPIAMALLFALVLSGPVEALHAVRIPRSLSAALILVAILGILAGMLNLVWEPAQQWFAAAPHTLRTIEHKIRPLAGFLSRVDELINRAGNMGSPAGGSPQRPPESAPGESAPIVLLDATKNALVGMVTVVILTLFLLAGGPPMLGRMTSAFVSDFNSAHAIDVIEKVRGEVGRFYVTTTLINVGLGLATTCAMMLCGMPSPFLWGTLAGLLNFIPYAGSTTTLIVLTLVAIISFDGLGHVLAVAGSYLLLATIEGQVVQPLLVGRRLRLNPLLVFLALWFGGLFWGIAGIILATPTLVALKVIAENSSGGKPLLEFLSPHARD